MSENSSLIETYLRDYRVKLLDLSRRNNLISFKHAGSSQQHIRIIDAPLEEVFAALNDDKKLIFRPLPAAERALPAPVPAAEAVGSFPPAPTPETESEAARHSAKKRANIEIAQAFGINPDYDLPLARAAVPPHGRSVFLQTLLRPEELNSRLGKLESYIRTDIEESGVNTLYAAFLFLEYYETSAAEPLLAPLLLMPLELSKERTAGGYRFDISATGDETELNLSLSESLKRQFGLELPAFAPKDDEAAPLSAYLAEIESLLGKAAILPQRSKWRLRRYLTVGRFHFARLVMYHDLDDKNWPDENKLRQNPIVESLLTKSEGGGSAGYAEDYDIDALEEKREAPLLITEADASQHSAIADIMQGKSLAIQGPPGTGKSQTIANIIANALAANKKILFLAEKMAALNVVYDRLNHAGLGAFCLELHSAKARKAEILKSVKERLNLRAADDNGRSLYATEREFNEQAAAIKTYASTLNSPFGRLGKTVYDYLWALQAKKAHLAGSEALIRQAAPCFDDADIDETALNRCKKHLAELAALKQAADADKADGIPLWNFVRNFSLNAFDRDTLKTALKEWIAHARQAEDAAQIFFEPEQLAALSFRALARFQEELDKIRNFTITDSDKNLITRIDGLDEALCIENFVETAAERARLERQIKLPNKKYLAPGYIGRLEGAIAEAKRLAAEGFSPQELRQAAEEQSRKLQLLSSGKAVIDHLKTALNLEGELNFGHIAALLELPSYISALPKPCLKYRQPSVIAPESKSRIEKFCAEHHAIEQDTDEFSQYFNMSSLGTAEELTEQAVLFEQAGIFSFLSPAFQQAKKNFKQAGKNKNSFSPAQAAEALHMLAAHQKRRARFAENKELAELCGAAFNGMETDFAALPKINLWADNVRKSFSLFDSVTAKMRAFLLEAEEERLNSLRELPHDKIFLAVKTAFAELHKNNDAAFCYSDFIKAETQKTEALAQLSAFLHEAAAETNLSFRDITKDLEIAQTLRGLEDSLAQNSAAKSALGEPCSGSEAEISRLKPLADFIRLCAEIPLPQKIFAALFQGNFQQEWAKLRRNADKAAETCQALREAGAKACALSALDFTAAGAAEWQDLPLPRLRAVLSAAANKPSALNSWLDYNHALSATEPAAAKLVAVYLEKELSFSTLPLGFEYSIYYALGREIYRRFPEIQKKGVQLESARETIQELGAELLKLNRRKIYAELIKAQPWEGTSSGPRKTWTEAALLHNETEKKQRHIPIRDLMKRAGKSILAIKPCFLMSPLTVAQYLAPGIIEFDLLIIDEASQMRPEEALGGIARAKQIIVVGDPKQLPPTSFFQSAHNNEETEEEVLPDDDIMQLALTAYRPARILTRHYRSRHESLIAFSNYHFYDNKLVLFPSPTAGSAIGLSSVYVGGLYKASANEAEVKAIARAALRFMRQNPESSLGIATMNQAQQGLIEMEMDKLFTENDYAEEYRLKWKNTLEPFFVKNLENVQGDERDAIFISTVYGPDENGTVMQRFGPINQAGGERRLNVLFSRAKQSMAVFTSLKPEDIKIAESASKGLRALKGFLAYAQTGRLDSGEETDKEADSDFEIWVKEKLEAIGCEAVPQIGVSGYRIDIGVKHPRFPYGYLLGVECDGAAYHSSKSARERDIIRRQVLERLGWNIYRIWSSDWFADPQGEFEKLKQHISGLLRAQPAVPPEQEAEAEREAEGGAAAHAADARGKAEAEREAHAQTAHFAAEDKTDEQEKPFAPPAESAHRAALFDKILYCQIQSDGSKSNRCVHIVADKGDPNAGTVSQYSEIGKALLNRREKEEISVTLPIGEVMLIINQIIKEKPNSAT